MLLRRTCQLSTDARAASAVCWAAINVRKASAVATETSYLVRLMAACAWFWAAVAVSRLEFVYALACLVVAAALREEEKFAIALTCCASVLILVPLLWEASVHLHAISTWTSAAAIVAVGFLAITLSWRKNRVVIPAVVLVSLTPLAAALLVATDDLSPFTMALLALAAATEFAACHSYPTKARWLAAVAAHAAVLLFSWLMSRAHGLPEGYVPTSTSAVLVAQLLLTSIYVVSALTQTLVRRLTLSFSEMAQTTCALLIGIGGIVWVFHARRSAMLELGIAGLVGGVACYATAFLLFDLSKWNFRAWATYGLFLVLTGTALLFSGQGFWALWCACALACCWAAMALRRPTLGLHGAVYLLLSSIVSGAVSQPLSPLLGIGRAPLPWIVSVGVLATAGLSWVAIAKSWHGAARGITPKSVRDRSTYAPAITRSTRPTTDRKLGGNAGFASTSASCGGLVISVGPTEIERSPRRCSILSILCSRFRTRKIKSRSGSGAAAVDEVPIASSLSFARTRY